MSLDGHAVGLRVLLVDDGDDHPAARALLSDTEGERIAFGRVAGRAAALDAMARNEHDLYLVADRLNDHAGPDLVCEARAQGCARPVILLAAPGDCVAGSPGAARGAECPDTAALDAAPVRRTVSCSLERTRLENALRESEGRFQALFAAHPMPMWVYDLDTLRLLQVNDAAIDHYGYTRDAFLAMRITDLSPAADRAILRRHTRRPRNAFQLAGEWRHLLKNGRLIDVAITSHTLTFAGRPAVLVQAHDITARKAMEETLRHQALHDSLTDLPNRVLFQDRLEQAILASRRDRHPVALLLLDLDRFKEVNDTFGHHHGDLLLQQVAGRLRRLFRASDTVARLGGDEFAVLLPGTDCADAVGIADKIVSALEAPADVDNQSVHVGASIGIALYPEHGVDGAALLRHADVAMYVAKRSGESCSVYSAEHDEYSADRLALLADLRRAIVDGELVLHYQPKVEVSNRRVCGVEALVRWQHPRRGLVRPDQFIRLAEQTGLIGALTCWVLDAALRQCAAWRRVGIDLPVAVNLSTVNLHDPQFPEVIATLLRCHALPATYLRLEVTESTLMADPARAQEVLTRLTALGMGISVDDYGTGYSSLAYLKRLPVDELKIDMTFVRQMAEDAADAAIVRSTIGLGHSLGLRVVAEGVEDQATWQLLVSLGCDVVQGYYLSRPLPAEELTHRLPDAPWAA